MNYVFNVNIVVPLSVKHDILAALTYFDIFDYPLTQTEILQFLRNRCSQKAFSAALYELTTDNIIYKFDDLYLLKDNYSQVIKRKQANARARKMLKSASRKAAILSAFPFVRGVAVSGPVSRNMAEENSGIDFFIITASKRLWIARGILQLFKKISFLFKKQDSFCMNYYIDEEMPEIREKNRYMATEIVTLLPLRGIGCFQAFFRANNWTREFLPNYILRISYVQEVKVHFFKRLIEFIFNKALGNLVDTWMMKLTMWWWNRKRTGHTKNRKGIILSRNASRHYAGPELSGMQKKIMQVYQNNLFRNCENRIKTTY